MKNFSAFALFLILSICLFTGLEGRHSDEQCSDPFVLNGRCTARRCALQCLARHKHIDVGECFSEPPNTCMCIYPCD
ncbi:hypothetical protein AQUCO_11300005v1 [Aquilegia coerulea]|uniref:Knottin scorpion toxin-like domain-containing protein n=1 Tax=Aquilegia coerulea TaxID=218851 RepID=A0A2G5C2K7_AQUCA|nr:hypothetical protein AQUCO_11300005v1 [Aquilegia coerulea]